jgi:hypothetical protein
MRVRHSFVAYRLRDGPPETNAAAPSALLRATPARHSLRVPGHVIWFDSDDRGPGVGYGPPDLVGDRSVYQDSLQRSASSLEHLPSSHGQAGRGVHR